MENHNHALWCEVGEHAFSPRTRGYEEWTKKVYDSDTGYPTEITMLVCPEHLTGNVPKVKGEIDNGSTE